MPTWVPGAVMEQALAAAARPKMPNVGVQDQASAAGDCASAELCWALLPGAHCCTKLDLVPVLISAGVNYVCTSTAPGAQTPAPPPATSCQKYSALGAWCEDRSGNCCAGSPKNAQCSNYVCVSTAPSPGQTPAPAPTPAPSGGGCAKFANIGEKCKQGGRQGGKGGSGGSACACQDTLGRRQQAKLTTALLCCLRVCLCVCVSVCRRRSGRRLLRRGPEEHFMQKHGLRQQLPHRQAHAVGAAVSCQPVS
jgi:hypothetical protein